MQTSKGLHNQVVKIVCTLMYTVYSISAPSVFADLNFDTFFPTISFQG